MDDYFGSVLYENGTAEDAAHHPLTKLLTPEGYVDYNTPGQPYCYYRQDHLGSIREVDSYLGNNRTVVQKQQYYPSGTPFADSFGAGVQQYKFTGKEMITMHGLNWQDFGARWLDNVRMQFTSMDPLAEKYYSISPYAYCMNNPVKYLDPDGKEVWLYATTLPMDNGLTKSFVEPATHTFIVVRGSDNVNHYYAYGGDNGISGKLSRQEYQQDQQVYTDQEAGKQTQI